MNRLSVFLVVLFAMTAGDAFAFDRSTESTAQFYFAIPFWAPTKAEATPRLGFRVGQGREAVGYTQYGTDGDTFAGGAAFGNIPFTLPRDTFDFRLGIDGAASLYVNGVDLEARRDALYANDGANIGEAWLAPLAIIGAGVVIFVGAKAVN